MVRQAVRSQDVAWHGRILISVVAFFAVVPMLRQGPSCGHDFDFHLLSWLEASQQFAQLTFPHWAYTPAFNAGEPRFIFYPPVSWTLGALLGFILPWTLVPVAFTWIALTLSGLTFHALARRYTSSSASTMGAVLYLANPYMLFTAYERSAYAELLAAAWLPLLVAAVLPPKQAHQAGPSASNGGLGIEIAVSSRRVLQLAIPVLLVWLTNAPAAVMSTYAVAFLVLVRLINSFHTPRTPFAMPEGFHSRWRMHLAITTAAGTVLGLALAAFYLLPAAYERRFVQIQMLVIEGMRVSDHFLFHRMPGPTLDDRFHDSVVHTASVIALTLIVLIVLALAAIAVGPRSAHTDMEGMSFWSDGGRRARLHDFAFRETILSLFLLTLAIGLLLTPMSLPVWNFLPNLAFLQFPWRLSAFLGLIFAFFTTLALPRGLHSLASSLLLSSSPLVAILFIAPAWHLFHQHCSPEDTVSTRVALFHSSLGTEPTDEYTPLHADSDALHPNDPPYWLVPLTPSLGTAINTPAPEGSSPGPAPRHLTLTLTAPAYLILNFRDYPLWQVDLNGRHLQLASPERRGTRDDGLIALLLPPGRDVVDLTLTRTPDETLGMGISGFALLACFYLYLRPRSSAQVP